MQMSLIADSQRKKLETQTHLIIHLPHPWMVTQQLLIGKTPVLPSTFHSRQILSGKLY